MIRHPDIDTAQYCLDELHESMSKLHDGARTQEDLDQVIIARYWGQVSAWTDKYMRAFADLRSSKSESEWRRRVTALIGVYDEGTQIREDFRLWLVPALEENLANLERRLTEERNEHPVSYWVLDKIFGPIFDGVDSLLKKYTSRGLYDRVVKNQEISWLKKISKS